MSFPWISVRRVHVFMLVCAAYMLSCCTSEALGQLNLSLPFRSNVDADKKKVYKLTDKNGPWLIVCASFAGDMGEIQARDLVFELRKKHNLKAYIYHKLFDHSASIKGIGYKDKAHRSATDFRPVPQEMKAQHAQKFVEIAVVVGDFHAADDERAKKTLEKIKYLHPDTLRIAPNIATSQRMGVLRELHKLMSPSEDMKRKGPMRAAFVIPNPLIPEEYFAQHSVDEFIMNYNRDFPNSLLNCPGNYSVRVATFRGMSSFESGKLERDENNYSYRLKKGQYVEKKLAAATIKASKLTAALRKMGYRHAYEFHDRNESYVCVGSFDEISRKQANGEVLLNANVIKIINKFKASTVKDFGQYSGAVRPKSLPSLRGTGIVFDIQPVPVLVPKSQRRFAGR